VLPTKKNLAKDENGYPFDSHNILNKWKIDFCHLLNLHGANDTRQTEMHIAEQSVPEPNSFEVKTAIEKLKRYESPGIDQIPAALSQGGGNILCSEIHKLMISIWKMEELPQQ
jgi:hypothetical protein